jgi:hypothetical protein
VGGGGGGLEGHGVPAHPLLHRGYKRSAMRRRRLQHALHPVLHGDSLAVVGFKVQVHARAEGRVADDQMHHAAKLGAFFVYSRSVKIIDLNIGLRPNGVGQGPGVF